MSWILRATKEPHLGATGPFGYFPMKDGVLQVDTFLEARYLRRLGFEDVTPAEIVQDNLNRPRKSIFLVRAGAIGDFLMITPFLRELRRRYPGVKITMASYNLPLFDDIFTGNPNAPDEIFRGVYSEYLLTAKLHDDAYDLSGTVEGNPEAEFTNAYEIPFHECKIPLEGVDLTPEYHVLPHEANTAKAELIQRGFDLEKPIIATHFRGSTVTRVWGFEKSLPLVKSLAQEGYQVLVFGDDRLPLEKRAPIASLGTRDLPLRISAAILSFCKLAITVDSGFLHLAQALKVPQIALSAAFDILLRTKHFKDCWGIQGKRRCAPCHLHLFRPIVICNRMEEEGYSKEVDMAPCMGNIPFQEVLKIAGDALKIVTSPGYKYGDMGNKVLPEPVARPTTGRPCPVCFTQKSQNVGFKGGIAYVRCSGCESLYAKNPPDEIKTYADYNTVYYLAKIERQVEVSARSIYLLMASEFTQKKNLLEVGAGSGFYLREHLRAGWEVMGIEKDGFLASYGQEKLGLQTLVCGDFESEELEGDLKFQVVILNDYLERCKDPAKVLKKALSLLETGGVLVLLGISADLVTASGAEQSARLVTHYPGQNRQILSEKAVRSLLEGEGLLVLNYKTDRKSEASVAVCRRKDESTQAHNVNLIPSSSWAGGTV